MNVDISTIISIVGALVFAGGLLWKIRTDKVDLLTRMQKAHDETWTELQAVRAENVAIRVENVAIKSQMHDLQEKLESSERYVKRLIVAMTDSGVAIPSRDDDESEQPPKRKRRE